MQNYSIPKDIYMSPRKAVQRFSQILNRCHPEAIKSGRNYREEKEAVVAAEVLYGIEKLYGGQHWLQNAEHISKDIDIKVISKIPNTQYHAQATFLQITEFESHNNSLIDVLAAKQKPGYDPGSLELIISVREKRGEKFYPLEIVREVHTAQPKYKAVWLLLDDIKQEWTFHLLKLYPNFVRVQYDIQESIDKAQEPDFIREIPKYGKYIQTESEFHLPLPPCPVCKNV